jgi:hypothetical protein
MDEVESGGEIGRIAIVTAMQERKKYVSDGGVSSSLEIGTPLSADALRGAFVGISAGYARILY